jgi:hypothetical protein
VFGENPPPKESLLMTAVMAEWLRKIKRNRLSYGARLASVDGAPLAAQVRTENAKPPTANCK